MKTDELRDSLLNRKQYVDRIIKEKEEDLKQAPDGKLRYFKTGNSYKYYCRTSPSDMYGRYIKKSEFITEKGDRVRSKSEWIIADTLFRMGIPYRYEASVRLKGIGRIHPDFTVLNVRRRKTYYWEHLGRMDDPSYSEKAIERICTYEKNGHFPGDSLLLTFETKENPLSIRQIKMVIERYLR